MLAQFSGRSALELSGDPRAIAVGRNLFANNCAACHGSDGRGAPGFPNITDGDWLWGGEPENIELTINEGRIGIMTPWIDVIGPKGVDDVVAYVMTLSGRKPAVGDAAAGKSQFDTICSACHGIDGRGNHALGAPNLTDNIWLYGGTAEKIRETVVKGRQGVMPAQGERLGEARVRLLAAYVISLGEPRVAHAGP
jgi:cytochrome c oxidase cbb3-type subunit 3